MIPGGLARAVAEKGIAGDADLRADKGQHRFGDQLVGLQEPARIAERTKLQGEAEPVLRPPAEPDVIEVGITQDIVLQQGGVVDRQREQRLALPVGEG